MSWRIYLIESTVKVSKALAKRLFKITNSIYEGESYNDTFYSPDDVIEQDGHLAFNPDHYEHMDYLFNEYGEELRAELCRSKVKGRVLFADPEHRNYWGHEFDGKGGYQPLKGTLQWSPAVAEGER